MTDATTPWPCKQCGKTKHLCSDGKCQPPASRTPPHGCGDSEDGPLCHMNLDGSCPRKSCSYYKAA